jgi:hypothetical protein
MFLTEQIYEWAAGGGEKKVAGMRSRPSLFLDFRSMAWVGRLLTIGRFNMQPAIRCSNPKPLLDEQAASLQIYRFDEISGHDLSNQNTSSTICHPQSLKTVKYWMDSGLRYIRALAKSS